MTSSIERLANALRRHRVLLVVCVIVGLGVALRVSGTSDPEYRATAQILLDQNATSAILPGADANPTNQQRSTSTAATLAGSGAFYDRVSRRYHRLQLTADAPKLPGNFSVEEQPGTDLLSVSGTSTTASGAQRIANTVAAEFPRFRGETLSRPLRETERSLQAQLRGDPQDQQLKDSLSRVRVLENLAERGAGVVDRAQSATKIRPVPARDAVMGLVSGLIVGLLFMALREGLTSRVRDDETIEQALRARVLASVPRKSPGDAQSVAAIERLVVLLGGRRNPDRDTVVCVLAGARGVRSADVAEAIWAELHRRGEAATQVVADATFGNGIAGVLSLPTGKVVEVAGQALATPPIGRGWVIVDGPASVHSSLTLELARVADVAVLLVPADITRGDLMSLSRELDTWPRRPYIAVITVG